MEEKGVKIYSERKKKNLKSHSSQMQVVVWRKSLSLFFPFLYSRGTEMTAAGRSGSTKVQWRRRTGMHIKDSRLECVHTFLSFSLSHLLSRRRAHTSHRLLSARQTAVFNLCDNTCGWPLICKGKPGAAPIWISTHLGYQGSGACAHRQAEHDEPGLALATGAWTALHSNTTQQSTTPGLCAIQNWIKNSFQVQTLFLNFNWILRQTAIWFGM